MPGVLIVGASRGIGLGLVDVHLACSDETTSQGLAIGTSAGLFDLGSEGGMPVRHRVLHFLTKLDS